MSELVVKVVKIEEVRPHSNADRLELVTIGGWQVVVQKDVWKMGDLGVYFPPDTLLPIQWTDRFGVTQYCQVKNDPTPDEQFYGYARIRQAKLRGEPSFGLLVPVEDEYRQAAKLSEHHEDLAEGVDVAWYFAAKKYEPPVKTSAGDADVDHPLFPGYTEIENLRNYPNVFQEGEEVVATEKIHGTNCRVGLIEGIGYMAGSKGLRRKMPVDPEVSPPPWEAFKANTYWYPLAMPEVRELLENIVSHGHKQVVLFGEVYGSKIQSYNYGTPGIGFRAFDLLVDGQYVDFYGFKTLMETFGVPMVPIIFEGPYDLEEIKQVSRGAAFKGNHIREGVVVKPIHERHDPAVGRVVLKYVSDAHLLGLKEDFTDR